MLAVERPVRAVLAGVLRGGGGGRSRDEGILLLGLEEGVLLRGEGCRIAEGSGGGGAATRQDVGARIWRRQGCRGSQGTSRSSRATYAAGPGQDALLPADKGVLLLGVEESVLLRGEAVAAQGTAEGAAPQHVRMTEGRPAEARLSRKPRNLKVDRRTPSSQPVRGEGRPSGGLSEALPLKTSVAGGGVPAWALGEEGSGEPWPRS